MGVVASQQDGACVIMSFWNHDDDAYTAPSGCNGEPTLQHAMPVGLKPLDMCSSVEKIDGTDFSIDVFCDFPQGNYHQNYYIGTKICDKEKSVLTMEKTAQSIQCVNLPGISVMYKCLPSPCPSDEASLETASHQTILDLHRQLFPF